MRIAKPILLVTTPLGVAIGLYEGFHLAGGLGILLCALIAVFGVAMLSVVRTVQRERQPKPAASDRPEAP